MRPEAYSDQHQASKSRQAQAADRRVAPSTLRALLRWASSAFGNETPTLSHSLSLTDEGGVPLMSGSARGYIGMTKRGDEPDDWLRIASRQDEDGFYLFPMRRALLQLGPERRLFARDLCANVLFPSDIAALHGIPEWCQDEVAYRTLQILWSKYTDRPLPKTGPKSESQSIAEAA